ncbi:hypothetical protein H6771_02010 [Candidatus Peribacteria bacterium]|nr:hypothetical protein [Candidatus Peribacteria bacterium]
MKRSRFLALCSAFVITSMASAQQKIAGYEGPLPQDLASNALHNKYWDMLLRPGSISISDRIAAGTLQWWDIGLVAIFAIDLLTRMAGTIAVVMFVFHAFQYMTASVGGDKRAEEALKGIGNVIGGLLITFLSWIIVNYIIIALTS